MKWADPIEDQRNILYKQLYVDPMYVDPKAMERVRQELMEYVPASPRVVTQTRTTSGQFMTAQQAGKLLSNYLSNLPRPRVERRMATEEEAGHYIRAAAQAIEQYGWVQRSLGSVKMGFCVIGAVSHVSAVYTDSVVDLFMRWLTAQGFKIDAVSRWNDAPGQDRGTILLYMHKYADEVAPLPAPLLREESDAI